MVRSVQTLNKFQKPVEPPSDAKTIQFGGIIGGKGWLMTFSLVGQVNISLKLLKMLKIHWLSVNSLI